MGKVRFGIPEALALKIRDQYHLRYFIETGTYKAGTTLWAAQNFEYVWTIEGWEEYYQRNINAHYDKTNITFMLGDSRIILPEVLRRIDEPALVWLDAHWLGNSILSAGTDGECPIQEEIAALVASGINHCILIDDARLFLGNLPSESDPRLWPSLDEIKSWLPGYYVRVFEDVIIAVPQEGKRLVEDHIVRPGISILVLTSNDYVHILAGFAYLFNKYWSDKQLVTALRYDRRPPWLPPNFYAPAAGKQSELTFSQGLRRFVESSYPSEMFILLLEDYYLSRKVDIKRINELWALMESNVNISKIDLSGDLVKREHLEYRRGLVEAAPEALYQTSLQAAIWRRDYLLRFLEPHENPWQFEKGHRVIYVRREGKFDGLVLGVTEPPLFYVNAVGGAGNRPGEYDHKKIQPEMWDELKEKGIV